MKFTRAGKEPACMSRFYYDAMRVSRPSFGSLAVSRRADTSQLTPHVMQMSQTVRCHNIAQGGPLGWNGAALSLSLSLSWCMLRSKIKESPREPYVRRFARCPKIRFSCAESTKHDPLLLIIELNDLIIYRSLLR